METMPVALKKSLAVQPKAKAIWDDLTPIGRRDYITWIESAKKEETRAARTGRVASMLLSGKRRPCCFAVTPMNLYKELGKNAKAQATWKSLSPDAKRDFSDWIEQAQSTAMRDQRIEKASTLLAAGKRRP